jgi:hypothetical protein
MSDSKFDLREDKESGWIYCATLEGDKLFSVSIFDENDMDFTESYRDEDGITYFVGVELPHPIITKICQYLLRSGTIMTYSQKMCIQKHASETPSEERPVHEK